MQFSDDARTSATLDAIDELRKRRDEIMTGYNRDWPRNFDHRHKDSKIYDEKFLNPYDQEYPGRTRFHESELASTDELIPITSRSEAGSSSRHSGYNDQNLGLPTPNAGKTTSEVYGSFLPGWNHTYVTQTSNRLKNRRLDMIKKAIPITSREYGIYYADKRYMDDVLEERLRDDYMLRSKLDYFNPNPGFDRYKPYSRHSNGYDYDASRLPMIHRWPETYKSMVEEPKTYNPSPRHHDWYGFPPERRLLDPERKIPSPERVKLPQIRDVEVRFEDGTSARMSPENLREIYHTNSYLPNSSRL